MQKFLDYLLLRRSRLQIRLAVLMLVAAGLPLVVAAILIIQNAQDQMADDAKERLRLENQVLAANTNAWLDSNVRALNEMVIQPDVLTMDAETQKPVLEAMHAVYPHMYLISTTDRTGINVARSDDQTPTDYSDRVWVQGALAGNELTYQSLVGRTSGEPALVISAPIRDSDGDIIGVGMFASDLDVITADVQASKIGDTGFAYIVDADNRVIAHPDATLAAELRDLSDDPVIASAREGNTGAAEVELDGETWQTYVDVLDNGWAIVVRQQSNELLEPLRAFRTLAIVTVLAGLAIMGIMTQIAVRYELRPIRLLTDTAVAVSQGDLSRKVPVVSRDEIGTLAQTFNDMTERLRGLIGNLEERVASRTRDLQLASRVSEQIATVLDPDLLLPQVVDLTKEAFDLYHAHIYLLDETGSNLVLSAGAGEVGRMMRDRGHRIPASAELSLVARAARSRQAVVVTDTAQEPAFLPNPMLPRTRSEAALPLIVGDRVVGVIDVQAEEPGRFDDDLVSVLTTMAGQIAVAINNARLFSEADRITRHEQALNLVTQAIQGATSMDDVLKVATRELGRALRVPKTAIELRVEQADKAASDPQAVE